MDFFLKRTPAFSRALGDEDSEDDYDEADTTEDEVLHFVDKTYTPIDYVAIVKERPTTKIVVSVGPLQTAFVTCALAISEQNFLCKLPFSVPNYGGVDVFLQRFALVYYLPESSHGTFVITLPHLKQVIHHSQKTVVDLLLRPILEPVQDTGAIELIILYAQPVHKFQAPEIPNESLVRILPDETFHEVTHEVPFTTLEQPNIIDGFAAEFMTYAHFRKIRSYIVVLYYILQDNPAYAWESIKELFDKLKPIRTLSEVFSLMSTTWDLGDSKDLKEYCISCICGERPTLMDQMYT
ncbi:unnamed protein product [Dicrocoelium dendriticum]|nr:unnamed protein product [Dicrocoelium dendriticum]